MAKLSKKSLTLCIVIICVVLVLVIRGLRPEPEEVLQMSGLERVKGDTNAPVKVTEYIDFQCPHCALGAKYLNAFVKQHPELIRLELKYFPLKMHKHALLSSKYAECAARQNKFWPFHDLLIDRQKQWKRLSDATPAFQLIAEETQLNLKKLETCLSDNSVNKVIADNKDEGKLLGVKSTPTYFVNGTMVVGIKSLQTELSKFLGKNEK